MQNTDNVIEKYNKVITRIRNSAEVRNRNFKRIKPILVIKYAKDLDVLELLGFLGAASAAESKLQDAQKRWNKDEFKALRNKTALHFIGALQKNKIAKIVNLFDYIDSVDTIEHAEFINAKAKEQGKKVNCLLQIKLTKSATQSGANPQDVHTLVEHIKTLEHINLKGFMAIAPQVENIEDLRHLFKEIKILNDKELGPEAELSLGMSNDFETAVEEGSTMPRIGSAIFG
ncbi:Alanine racemase domain protein [Elusimicrobium minutum Pei191]|uniref:Alanine racemase domain protein n=1 Tax=Elusimicrobium minutum (strain Pei191) TaxID=445932 RepID=B2KCU8_ELUMP|nr:YggS family pyridoxal phosphate-dependent enzyme [Elusimicrobium minutum]ACC98344.1 Alanine racemase domain protein [Elusimicrobium minutum Pei191]